MARFDASRYPGERPGGPVVVVGDEVHPLRLDGSRTGLLRAADPGLDRFDLPVLRDGVARFGVAYGSNASPQRLMDKGLTVRGAVLLPAVVRGWVAAFEARRTGYGAVPLTFVPVPGVRTVTWVLGLDPRDLDLLDRTEGRVAHETPRRVGPGPSGVRFPPPGTYRLGRIRDVEVAGRWLLRHTVAYVPGPSTRVQRTRSGWRSWPEHDQAEAAAHVDAGGPAAAPPPVGHVVVGAWPRTPLLPLAR